MYLATWITFIYSFLHIETLFNTSTLWYNNCSILLAENSDIVFEGSWGLKQHIMRFIEHTLQDNGVKVRKRFNHKSKQRRWWFSFQLKIIVNSIIMHVFVSLWLGVGWNCMSDIFQFILMNFKDWMDQPSSRKSSIESFSRLVEYVLKHNLQLLKE
jgi:hypothetical protein